MKKNKKNITYDNTLNIVSACSYILQMIIAFIGFFNINNVAEKIIASFEELKYVGFISEDYINQMADVYRGTGGKISIFLMILVCFVFPLIGLIFTKNKTIKDHKVMLIIFAIVTIDTSNSVLSFLYTLLAIVSLVLVCICKGPKVKEKKKDDKKEEVQEKKKTSIFEIKKFKSPKITRKTILFSILIILTYFYCMFAPFEEFFMEVPWYIDLLLFPIAIPSLILTYLGSISGVIESILIYIILIVMSIGFYFKEYKQMFATYSKKIKFSLKYVLANFGRMYLFYLPAALIINLTFGQSANQESISEMPILITTILALLYAPLVEETVFRGALRKLIKNNIVYILISGIAFGLIHTIGQEATITLTLIKAIPYAVMGGYFAYVYTKNGNMMYNISLHFAVNLLGVLVMAMGII